MFAPYLLILLWGVSTLAQEAPPGTSSLAFIFDTTGSMYDDLVQVREGAKRIYTTVMEQREKLIYNYVLMPFHDPEVGPVVATTDPHFFQRKLQNLYVQGGGDCPEMSITGIKGAVEAALPASFLYVFTDSRSKDYHLTDQVLTLIQQKQSQVVFVMTGDCGNRSHPGYTAFERIASASSGQIFHLEKSDVNEVLNYVRISVQTRKVNIHSVDNDNPGPYLVQVPVDSHLFELTVSLSGSFPDIQLRDPDGKAIKERDGLQPVLDLGEVIVVSVKNPKAGVWQLRTSSKTKDSVRVTGIGAVDFVHGFAAKVMNDIAKAHRRPLKGVLTYMMVNMSGLMPPGFVKEIALVDLRGNTLYTSPATVNKESPYMYFTGPLMPPDGYYFVRVNGHDEKNYEFQRISLTAISPETAGGPRAYMQPQTLAFRTQSVNLTCSVESRAPYTLYWYKGDFKIGGPFFFKLSETAIWTLPEVTVRDRGEYSCMVTSAAGNDTASTMLETKEPPPHIVSPRNVTVAVGSTAYLHCRTQSVGQASITWQRRGVPLQSTNHFSVFPNGTLRISDASKGDEGPYVCHVITRGGDATAKIFLNVLQLPKALVDPDSLYYVKGGSFNISCLVRGDPLPKAEWYFNNRLIRPGGRYYVTYKYDLIVRSANEQDAGRYECRAVSAAGRASGFCESRLAIAPNVKVSSDKEMIGRGDTVTLECVVTAGTPAPTITWYKGGREMSSFRYITIQGGRLIIQGAQDADAGEYTCIASNVAGRAEGRIRVDVGSIPSIVPSPETVTANIESDVTLQCRATGHPTPTISWQKVAKSGGSHVIVNSHRYTISPDGGLMIKRVTMEDQTRYVCTATNRFGSQDAVRTLMVTGLISPVLGHVSPEEQLIEGSSLRLSCVVVLGTPKPTLAWFKNDLPLRTSANVQIEGSGSGLMIQRGTPAEEGRYTCVATNAAGNASIHINVQVISKPTIAEDPDEYTVNQNERLQIACRATGRPEPTISWIKDGKILLFSSPNYAIQPNGNLVIHTVERGDGGMYTCTASNAAGETRRAVRVKVNVAPNIALDRVVYNVIQGQTVSMSCVATGDPEPAVAWYHEGLIIESGAEDDGSLTISDASEDHRGKYKCIATNVVGSANREVTLTVHTAPVINGSGEVKIIRVNVNQTAKFPCPARAEPPPTRTWMYEGRRVFRGYSHGSELRFTGDGSLVIATSQMQHAGRYKCEVSNLAGNDSIIYELIVRDPPRIISDLPGTIDVVLDLLLEIPCKAVGTPKPVISWRMDEFEILPDEQIKIDPDGTLRIAHSQLTHAGRYTCTAKNVAGEDNRVVTVVVQEPPTILASTVTEYTAVEGDKVEMHCLASGAPNPEIHWLRRGVMLNGDQVGVQSFPEEGRLVLTSVQSSNHGPYVCRAVNAAGEAEIDIKLTVIVPPDIPDQGSIVDEEVLAGGAFSLYCPVFSTPIPEITWEIDGRPIAEGDSNVELSDDKRRLHILKARVTDAGVYKCIARNQAGSSTKTFEVEVLVPPNLDESKWKRKVEVIQNTSVTLGCPVQGVPEPTVNWLVNGQLLTADTPQRGLKLSDDGKKIEIASAQLDHEGSYTCLANNKAGSLDIDIMLTVLAPPSLGSDEVIEVVEGQVVSMNCNPKEEGLKSSITWLLNGGALDPTSDVQVALGGRRLFIMKAVLANEGGYTCIVRNSAGETRKNFKLVVLVPPEFTDKQYEQNIDVNEGQGISLGCHVKGHPTPTVTWQQDGTPLDSQNGIQLTEENQLLRIEEVPGLSLRYTCMAENKAGKISRDFFVQQIVAPVITSEGEREVIEVIKGSSVTLQCPVATNFGGLDLQWLRDGRPVPTDQEDLQISLDRTRLHMINIQEEDEAVYTCIAKNPAGQATREFQLVVIIPPSITGRLVEDITVIEGRSLTMRCEFSAKPAPKVSWIMNGKQLSERAQLLSDGTTVYVAATTEQDGGSYFCTVQNKAGKVEKTFNVRVILKPEISHSDEETTVEVLVTTPITLDCAILNPVGVNLTWLMHEQPLDADRSDLQVLAGGRHLHIGAARRSDAGRFTCIAKNEAGQATKAYKLIVLVPPSIVGEGGSFSVVENNSVVLPCETDGIPIPKITWTKDRTRTQDLPNVEIVSEGQQFRITQADDIHDGAYLCTATNKVGKADLGFDVDVISKPSVAQAIKDTIEVIVNQSADFRCPITDRQYNSGQIKWLRDHRPIVTDGTTKYLVSQSGRKLHLTNAQLTDEGSYSCRVKNPAGETTVDFKLIVLEPPVILMLEKDKNRTVVENSTTTLSCPAEGKPDPVIAWYKDGEKLESDNVGQKIASAQLIGNQLRIARIQVDHSGRFSCTATNKAGMAEQDIMVYVMTPPRIEREGIPSEIDGIVGRRVSISCPAYGRPPPTVTWLKAGRPMPESDDVYLSASGQRLHIISVSTDHLDRYTCIAKNPAGEDKRDFTLQMLKAPTIAGTNVPRNVQVVIGRTAVLECPAEGSPEPTISWLKNGHPLEEGTDIHMLQGGKQLQINNAQLDDTARYTCIAANPIGVVDLDTFVDVIGPPKVEGKEVEIVEVVESQSVILDCTITGSEPLDIEWLSRGETLQPVGYMQITAHGRNVHILAARTSDEGRYTCVGRNQAGEARKSFELKVLVPPSINDTQSSVALQTIIPGDQFRIECRVRGIPFPTITWHKDGVPFTPDESPESQEQLLYDNQTILIRIAKEKHGARYTCSARNKVGVAEKDFIIQLRAPPVVDQGVVSKEVNVGDYVILTCRVTGGTGDIRVQWLIDGHEVQQAQISPSVVIEDRRVEIKEARLSDTARYTCVVTNEAGEAQKHFDLTVLEPPRFLDTTNLSPSIILGRPLILDCSVTGTPKPTVTWSKDGIDLVEAGEGRFLNERQQYEIAAAEERHKGRYSCIAENKAGRAEKDLVVAVLLPPTMGPTATVIEVPENDTLTLECPVNMIDVEIQWSKNGIPVTTSRNLQLSSSGRKLHLMKARTPDAAVYSCVAKNDAGQVNSDIQVIVLVPPRITGKGFNTIESVVNQTVQVECRTSGIPEPQISWSVDGRPLVSGSEVLLLNNGSVLRLMTIQESQEGRYTCTAVNKVGRAEMDTFVNVIAPPQIAPGPSQIKVILGQGQTIRCEVRGSPAPTVTWLKNGQKFESALVHSSFDTHYIHVVEAKVSDAGRYTCMARNRAGEDRMNVELVVLVPPLIESGERVLNVIEGRSLAIDCVTSGLPHPTLTWTKDSVPIDESKDGYDISGDGGRLTIIGAKTEQAGRYNCEARNEAGSATVDFAVDVYVRPTFKDLKPDVRVVEGERATLECKVDAHPQAQIRWLKAGRPLESVNNIILSPRGEHMMILDAKRTDSGSYSCVAKNAAGEAEASFTVTVLVAPHIDAQIDQNPKVVVGKELLISCPVLGIPEPKVEWKKNGVPVVMESGRVQKRGKNDLHIIKTETEDEARYTCHAYNEAGELDTDFAVDVIAPPKFGRGGVTEYEVIQGQGITMDCDVEATPKPSISWLKGDAAVYLDQNVWISADGQQLTVVQSRLSDGGRYTCKATNVAGTTNVEMILHVLVPPTIDKSNIIGNPLAIVNRSIHLECPATGIPSPTVRWLKDGQPINREDERITLSSNNQTIKIEQIRTDDFGRYTCVAENKAGRAEQDFNLEVLTAPRLQITGRQKIVKHAGESFDLTCPVIDQAAEINVGWSKDGRPLDPLSIPNMRISSEGRRLNVIEVKITDAGLFRCIASNRAGESQLEFEVDVLSPPKIDGSRNDPQPRVIQGRETVIWCMVSGHPVPTVTWYKEGKELTPEQFAAEYSLIDAAQGLRLNQAEKEHAGRYTCVAKNDAGQADLDIAMDVWEPPTVSISGKETIKPLQAQIVLHCQAAGNPQPTLSWTKDGQPLLSSPTGARISGDGRRLDIPRLHMTDIGDYTCTARNDAGTAEASVHVDVLVPPTIRREGIDMNPRLPSGQTIQMQCDVIAGKPDPDLFWFVGDEKLEADTDRLVLGPEGKHLQISDMELSDAGFYKCQAVNVAGEDAIIYNVEVVQSPLITSGGTIQVIEGDPATIQCDAIGEPLPEITWQRNGQLLDTRDRYFVGDKFLRINQAKSQDAGIYVCVADNEAGTAQQAYTLEVLVPPKITMISPNTVVPIDSSFDLKCVARGYPDPEIQWFKGDEQLLPNQPGHTLGGDGTLRVDKAPAETSQVYKCVAKNAAGQDEKETKVSTIKAPTILSDGLKVINVTQGDPTVMICEVTEPIPNIVWYKGQAQLDMAQNPTLQLSNDLTRLKIGDTRLTDDGEYRCVAQNPAGNATQRFRLNVGVPPKITEEPRRVIANNGSRADLPCEAVGVPNPTISWLDDKTPVDASLKRGDSVVFSKAEPENAKVYTCKAENWAGTAYKDIELIVLVPPQIHPPKMNITVKEKETVVLPCNATGIPEPLVSWSKEPNLEITGGQKYNILGTSLAIRNANEGDDSFYRCVAKNSAGVAVGYRKLNVEIVKKEWRIIWVECDDLGRPIRTTYVPKRGDVPSDETDLLPWKTEFQDLPENGTNNILIRCMPGRPRQLRDEADEAGRKPLIYELPKNSHVGVGETVRLGCKASGKPVPEIMWTFNGRIMPNSPPSSNGESVLEITNAQLSESGDYMCLARNQHGSTRASADVVVGDTGKKIVKAVQQSLWTRKVAVLSCRAGNSLESIYWTREGSTVISDNKAHVLKNGSLVVFEPFDAVELKKYQCQIGRSPGYVNSVEKHVQDAKPIVLVLPNRVIVQKMHSAFIHCRVTAEPLTTQVTWYRDGSPVILDHRTFLHANNTLELRNVRQSDRAVYRCSAQNSAGIAYDEAALLVQDAPQYIRGQLSGSVNGIRFATQPLYANVTPTLGSNEIYMQIDSFPTELSPASRAALGFVTCPTWALAHQQNGASNGFQKSDGKFTQNSEYRFMTGEEVSVKQTGGGLDSNGYLIVDVLLDGKVPDFAGHQVVRMDPFSATYVQNKPGHVQGFGKTTFRVSPHYAVPMNWNHEISYEGPSSRDVQQRVDVRSIDLTSRNSFSNDKYGYILQAATRAHRDCPPGFERESGRDLCHDVDECLAGVHRCLRGQKCQNTMGSFKCVGTCQPGFYMADNGTCYDLDECTLGMAHCEKGQQCMNTAGSYRCTTACAPGFKPTLGGGCQDRDECLESKPCHPDQICLNAIGSFHCFCPQGYTSQGADKPCQDLNECLDASLCSHQCVNVPGSFACLCPSSMQLTSDRRTCVPVSERVGLSRSVDQNQSQTTLHHVIQSKCPRGYQVAGDGATCKDIDECRTPGICGTDALCFNTRGAFQCLRDPCPPHYTLDTAKSICHCNNRHCSTRAATIQLQMLALPLGVPAERDLLRLSAFDKSGRLLRQTRFHISDESVPFGVRQRHGRGTLFTRRALRAPRDYRLNVRATSFAEHGRRIKFQTDFLLFISVGEQPF